MGDDGVADVEFLDLAKLDQGKDIFIIEAMASGQEETHVPSQATGLLEPFQLGDTTRPNRITVFSGMKLHGLGADFFTRLNLGLLRVDEEGDKDASLF
jgi:hypothetical protein